MIGTGFENADLTVTRSQGSRGADGWKESSTKTVLDCRADFQQAGRTLEQRAAYYEAGDALAYPVESVADVEVGDDATIDHDDGRSLSMTVEEIIYDDPALLLSFDG